MKAETQTHKESKNKKFTFPRNSLTYESVSEQTDPYLHSQNDARSHLHNEDFVFDTQRPPIQIETDKLIQYELMSKESEHMRSIQGAMGQGGGGMYNNNSFAVSGTPTSNYYNQQTFYQINYIGYGRQGGLTNQGEAYGSYTTNQNSTTQINGGKCHSVPPEQVQQRRRSMMGGVNSTQRGENQESKVTLKDQRTQEVIRHLFRNIFNQEYDFGQQEVYSQYLQTISLVSPRQIRAAVINYDKKFLQRDDQWRNYSVVQKMYYLFESMINLESQVSNLKMKHQNILKYCNSAELEESSRHAPQVKQFTIDQQQQLKINSNTVESSDSASSIKHFLEEIEVLKNQILQKNSRIEFLDKKVSLLEEQSFQLKSRINQNIEQYEQEIQLKDEINQREKENLLNQLRDANDEIEKQRNEFLARERNLKYKPSERAPSTLDQYTQQEIITLGGNSTSSNGAFPGNRQTRMSICSLPRTSQMGTIQDSLQQIESNMVPINQRNSQLMMSPGGGQGGNERCQSQLATHNGSNHMGGVNSSFNQCNSAARTKKKGKNLRLSMGDVSAFKGSSRANQGIVLKSDQIKRVYNNQAQQNNLTQVNQNTFMSPSAAHRQSIQENQANQMQLQQLYPDSRQTNLNQSFNSNILQQQLHASHLHMQQQQQLFSPHNQAQQQQNIRNDHSMPTRAAGGRTGKAKLKDVSYTVRSKTPTDNFSNTYKRNDLYKQLQLATLGGGEINDSLSATKDFFREMKSQSITKIMSPNNNNSDTAQFFADLNQSYNLATVKGGGHQNDRQGKMYSSNFNVMRGSIGSKLSKLKIKPENSVLNNLSIRNKSMNSATYKDTIQKKLSKGDIVNTNQTLLLTQNTASSPIQSQTQTKNKQFIQFMQNQYSAKNNNVKATEQILNNSNEVIIVKRNNGASHTQEPKPSKRPIMGNKIAAKNIRISPYNINWHKQQPKVNLSFQTNTSLLDAQQPPLVVADTQLNQNQSMMTNHHPMHSNLLFNQQYQTAGYQQQPDSSHLVNFQDQQLQHHTIPSKVGGRQIRTGRKARGSLVVTSQQQPLRTNDRRTMDMMEIDEDQCIVNNWTDEF